MDFIYPFLITFMLVFLSELGDKTQLLVLSFSSKDKAMNILLGVAIGTFLAMD
ncbi:MAG: TMEM165/GDT1 family protein [Clostridia bacterium]|nr:TMEM165/GDT1 family protein [Clostridia bacterium]